MTLVATSLLLLSMTGASAVTVTDACWRASRVNLTSSVWVSPTRIRTFWVTVAKLGSVITTVYGPGCSERLKKPLDAVVADRDAPVSSLVAVTVAPGSEPPVSSVTLPRRVPAVVCAMAGAAP